MSRIPLPAVGRPLAYTVLAALLIASPAAARRPGRRLGACIAAGLVTCGALATWVTTRGRGAAPGRPRPHCPRRTSARPGLGSARPRHRDPVRRRRPGPPPPGRGRDRGPRAPPPAPAPCGVTVVAPVTAGNRRGGQRRPRPAGASAAPMRWTGLALGTCLAILAFIDGARLRVGGMPSWLGLFLGAALVWALIVLASAALAELTVRHHRTAIRGGWVGRRGAHRGVPARCPLVSARTGRGSARRCVPAGPPGGLAAWAAR